MKINQLNELIGSVIPEITLTVDAVYPPKTGTGKKGAWHIQNLGCSDETGKIRVSVWNHSEMDQTLKGHSIKLKSIAGKRGLSGVVCEMNEYIDKKGEEHKDLQLKVNDNGIIITQSGSVGSKSLDTGYDKKVTPAIPPSENLLGATGAGLRGNEPIAPKPTTNDPQAKLGQYASLYKACLDKADTVKHIGFNNEDYRQIATAFWIQGMRDGLHLQITVKPDLEDEDSIPF